jgi:8-oxo-dGTP diphosphatase
VSRVRVVAGIFIDSNDAVLIADRTRSRTLKDHWEFPGGKIAEGESKQTALCREIAEELGVEVLSVTHFKYIEHDYPEHAVAIDFYRIEEWKGEPAGIEGQRLRWVDRASLQKEELLPADGPVIESLQSL